MAALALAASSSERAAAAALRSWQPAARLEGSEALEVPLQVVGKVAWLLPAAPALLRPLVVVAAVQVARV